MLKSSISITAFAALLGCVSPFAAAQTAGDFEPLPTLRGDQLLAPELLAGPQYRVKEPIALDGVFGVFELDSDFGHFRVLGRQMLAVRIRELKAIDELGKVDKGAAFGEALARSATAPVTFVGHLIVDPGKTVENVANGMGTVFGRLGRVGKTGSDRVADSTGDMNAGATQRPTAAPADPGSDDAQPRAFNDDLFGYNKARREWAKKLSIDPYTTNPILAAKLDDVATATFSGGFAIDTAIGVVAAPLKYAVQFDATVREAVWELPPGDLEARNEKKLTAMGITGRPVRDFFRNRWFTPTLQTALVDELERLPNVRGREAVVAVAANMAGEARTRALISSLRLLSGSAMAANLTEIDLGGLIPVARTSGGDTIVAASVDYIWWSEAVAAFVNRADFANRRVTLLIWGQVSDRAMHELRMRAWTVRTEVQPA